MISLQASPMWGWSANLFEFWWCLCIKFIFPWAMWWLLVMITQADIEKPYGGYHVGW